MCCDVIMWNSFKLTLWYYSVTIFFTHDIKFPFVILVVAIVNVFLSSSFVFFCLCKYKIKCDCRWIYVLFTITPIKMGRGNSSDSIFYGVLFVFLWRQTYEWVSFVLDHEGYKRVSLLIYFYRDSAHLS